MIVAGYREVQHSLRCTIESREQEQLLNAKTAAAIVKKGGAAKRMFSICRNPMTNGRAGSPDV
ncbi:MULTISPECIES: hypothetical protein [unclassified Bradyrhizobium]|uniref:hypothetical protein n=1 Tax=unclassified Bradyrhizobium TaxID=2631580 RepID=UPI001CD2A91E|nr:MULTISPECIES: hypothetical protein [unclassified Bradyrhizobium]MCA1384317.1 hypothetical protein [Bradyrhizobium sp. BRP05]MCA1392732.1 hypothetical protein [Bradyrhizobium sp. IC3123]MCA1421059.1 hypothetical protein [Bradyrhizobium sp. BRP23]MCA1428429.1 hypothetical protein [Bradyrhizobium sp. NBAIM16]MCA1479353.1 hypothetical protein [Bradyrhizobium sp. NBAIM08]